MVFVVELLIFFKRNCTLWGMCSYNICSLMWYSVFSVTNRIHHIPIIPTGDHCSGRVLPPLLNAATSNVLQGAPQRVWGLVPAGSVCPLGTGGCPAAGHIWDWRWWSLPMAVDILPLPHQQVAPQSFTAGEFFFVFFYINHFNLVIIWNLDFST